MPKYKLIYFDARGRGEIVRLLFELAEVEYEDYRIDYFEEWADVKQKMPFQVLPVLEVDGKQLTESKAIYRYLAKEFGYYGSNNWESAHIDFVVEMLGDLHIGATEILHSDHMPVEDKEKLIANYKALARKTLATLEKKLWENNDGKGYFVGETMTVADVGLFAELTFVSCLYKDDEMTKEFSKLEALKDRVGENDKIAAWIARRPDTFI